MTVYSYVFDHTAPPPTEFGQILSPGQFLFAYFLDGDETVGVSVDSFSVGNPYEAMITVVGYESAIVPAGYVATDYQNPFIYGYSGTAQASIFTYFDDMNPVATLEPTEWSLVWYVANAADWTLGPGTGTGGGVGDNQSVPVPIPAPGTLGMLALTAVMRRRRARR
jgi:hypothetical protein